MKLLASVLLASAAVEARQRREGDMNDVTNHGDMSGDMTHGDMTHGDMTHGDMTHGDMTHGDMTHGDMTHGDMTEDHGDMKTTTEHMMHTTTTAAPHNTHAHTTHAPHTEKPHSEKPMPKPCEGQKCGCNAEEMMRWKNEMREWKYDQEKWQFEFRNWMREYGTDNDWEHADFGPGFDWDASWDQQNMGGDINIDQGMAWQFAQWLTQADEICPLMNLLQLGDLGLPKNINLQDECRFQARQLAGFVELFSHLPTMNNHYTNTEWSNHMCGYVANMVSSEMSRYGFDWMSHTPHWANDACSCLTNIFMDAAEGNFNVMNLGMCAMNVQSLITNAMQYDWELKAFAPEAIEEYVVAIETYITDNAVEIDWTSENFGKLFMVWGFPELDLTSVDAVYNAIANAWAWNVSMNTGVSLEMFFDLFINVDTYIDFIYKRMAAFGVDVDNELEVGFFLSDEKNQNKLVDMKAIDEFVFGFFKDPEFDNKLNIFVGDFDLSVFGEGWSIANWFNNNFGNWDQENWTYPSITVRLELFNFFNEVVMLPFTTAGLDWSAAFVMNLINCASIDDLNTLFTNDGFETWLTDLATSDLDKFQCIARVPRDMNLFGIKTGMFNVNANGLSFFENIDFSKFFNIDFSVGFTGFDLASFATLDETALTAFNFDAFNSVLQPFFSAFEIFNLMGVFNFDVTAIDATNILNFDLNNIVNAFEEIAMFFLKYEFQDRDFKSVVEFSEAVTEFMNDFIYWFNNLSQWVDSFNARKAYIFSQLEWELENVDNEAAWAVWAANPTNWGQLIYGTRSWMKFQDVMDHIHAEMDEDMKESAMSWMQFLSGQTVEDFDFAEWAMNGMENGFGYEAETGFWTVMNTFYRDTFAEFGFFDEYKEGAYSYNAGGVIATAACMQFTDFTPLTINFDVNPNDFGEKFDECFYMFYKEINAEWGN